MAPRAYQALAITIRLSLLLIVLWLGADVQYEIKVMSSPANCNSIVMPHAAESMTVYDPSWKQWFWLRPWPIVVTAILVYAILRISRRVPGRANLIVAIPATALVTLLFVLYDVAPC